MASASFLTSNSLVPAQLALDCATAGVSTVEVKIYDETNSVLASGNGAVPLTPEQSTMLKQAQTERW